MTTIWHNPRCSKSRDTLKLIEAEGISPTVRLYLKDPPSPEELRDVLLRLGLKADDIIRKGEAVWREINLSDADEDRLIKALSAHPILIERPIVINGPHARIGRPPSNVIDIL